MTGYFCPVEGCSKHTEHWENDQPPFASREAVRSHTNAKGGDDHQRARDEGVWKEAQAAAKAQTAAGTRVVLTSSWKQPKAAPSSQTSRQKAATKGMTAAPQAVTRLTRATTTRERSR